MNFARSLVAFGCAVLVSVFSSVDGQAAEGASSHYLPGVAGDLAMALPPKPGFQFANIGWYQNGHVGSAVMQGRVEADLNVDVALDIIAGFYTFDEDVLGGTLTIGAAIPFGYAKLKAEVAGANGRRVSYDEDRFDLSDVSLTPFALTWNVGKLSFKFAEIVIAPTGGYDVDRRVNLGRNYWSFDTVGAVTWLNPETGTEVSVQPGLMLNTKNQDTNYRTGAEFHVDAVANQFLSKTFALGLRGYYYKQISGDKGSGARLGDFKSESLGLGGGFLWVPAAANGKLSIAGRVMTDVHAKNRFDSTYSQLTVGWKF